MTNQATQMLLRVQLIPIRRQSYPRAAGSSSKETPCQHHRTVWSVSLIVCGGLRTLKLCFIYLLRIIGPFHWHVAVPVRMEPLGCQWRVSTDVPFDVKPPSNWEIQVRPGSLETVYNTSRKGWWFNWFVLTMTAEKTGLNQYSAVQEDQHGLLNLDDLLKCIVRSLSKSMVWLNSMLVICVGTLRFNVYF